ncbi:MAG: sugar ABC transporter ATP-binding protein [Lachnospiraceae bacterium]|nr:sugar ABC transporter ATP-binding protein [Lachnospiraceae bacterium]
MENFRLELKDLHKKFPGVYAVKGVSMQIMPGEVHALVGENGAGKSTLMKMITGEYIPDEGAVYHNGKQIKPRSISDATANGISMIHQELAPLPNMTIAHNIFLGQENMKGIFLDDRGMNREAEEVLKEYKMDFPPTKLVGDLSVAQTQMLEIIKSVRKNADVIIMDEPTSSLSNEEANLLFEIIDDLKAKNISIIYISHRLEEIIKLADRITVLRDGAYIKTVSAQGVRQEELVEMMVGRKLDQIYPKEEVSVGDTVFSVKNLNSKKFFNNISFGVRAGEILGFYGLVGAGRSEIMQAIFGIDPLDSGEIYIEGKEIKIRSSKDAIDNRIALISEDRRKYGLVLCRPVRENITLPNLYMYFKNLFIPDKKERKEVQKYKDSLSIKCHTVETTAGSLSGGNQQKIVIAKWLMMNPKVMIMDEPTRGIDVGAKFEIYKIMGELAKQGMAIIMISSELPECLGMSDRIIVVSGGHITGEFKREEYLKGIVTQKDILNSSLQEV